MKRRHFGFVGTCEPEGSGKSRQNTPCVKAISTAKIFTNDQLSIQFPVYMTVKLTLRFFTCAAMGESSETRPVCVCARARERERGREGERERGREGERERGREGAHASEREREINSAAMDESSENRSERERASERE